MNQQFSFNVKTQTRQVQKVRWLEKAARLMKSVADRGRKLLRELINHETQPRKSADSSEGSPSADEICQHKQSHLLQGAVGPSVLRSWVYRPCTQVWFVSSYFFDTEYPLHRKKIKRSWREKNGKIMAEWFGSLERKFKVLWRCHYHGLLSLCLNYGCCCLP